MEENGSFDPVAEGAGIEAKSFICGGCDVKLGMAAVDGPVTDGRPTDATGACVAPSPPSPPVALGKALGVRSDGLELGILPGPPKPPNPLEAALLVVLLGNAAEKDGRVLSDLIWFCWSQRRCCWCWCCPRLLAVHPCRGSCTHLLHSCPRYCTWHGSLHSRWSSTWHPSWHHPWLWKPSHHTRVLHGRLLRHARNWRSSRLRHRPWHSRLWHRSWHHARLGHSWHYSRLWHSWISHSR